ncbi:hypothetical protein AB6A40_007586 [Gnathostoma spinigerum]|uniref:RBR-type E3 ubiquitin transferase n=1 Tax=Gnathostoma spinigerum TaxID=75299 RepID=A0ABD6ENV0_9BILA
MACSVSPGGSASGSDDETDIDFDDYYGANDYCDDYCDEDLGPQKNNPEFIDFKCLDICQVERLLNETVAHVADELHVSPSLSKALLHLNHWDEDAVIKSYTEDSKNFLIQSRLRCASPNVRPAPYCAVCISKRSDCGGLISLDCGHQFCLSCWQLHFETQLNNGLSTKIECMASNCSLICPEDFVLEVLKDRAQLRAKYEQFVFCDHVGSHPQLRFCAGRDCSMVIQAKCQKAKMVTCSKCNTSFCVRCGGEYHAPTSCETIKKWLIKCADDSETANYISAHTKDCPNCHSCIEKNGGCNHMQCAKCKHHFCWMCFGDWKTHGSEYYECSRYKENPAVAQEANHVKARRALEKYLHYYERYENHHKSLKLEEVMKQGIRQKINEKVNCHEGTWIDWQHLHRAATLLTKCRYTLQYTYPYAYFMENGPRKELFEYQQAQLEKEIEELSWKVERAESTERGDLENQMHVAERKRLTLLEDFFD